MKKVWKKGAAGILSAAMIFSMTACGSKEEGSTPDNSAKTGQEAENLDWLDRSGNLPIVKEGVDKTLTIAVKMNVDSGNPEDMWMYKFIEEKMNINLDVIKYTDENMNEYLSLTFADGDLPDIIIGGGISSRGGLTPADLVTYGAVEGQLLDLAPYINETYMPNLAGVYAEHPEYKSAVTDADGHVWSLGYINDPKDRGQIQRGFINYDWLEEANLEVPETLDDFINMLRTFKQRGDDIIPMGGSYESNNPSLMILNAFGYNTPDAKGLTIGLRDGKVVLPVADKEAYGAYLEAMNTIYAEGLIDPNFYTTDSTTSNAILSSGKVGFMAQAPFVFMSDFSSWWGAKPLTSEYNDTQMWPESNTSVNAGNFVVSADCEEVELALAFADWFFEPTGQNYEMSGNGPSSAQTDYLLGEKGFEIDPETKVATWVDITENPNLYQSSTDYMYKKINLWSYKILGMGNTRSTIVKERMAGWAEEDLDDGYPDITGMEDASELRTTLTDGEMNFRVALEDTLVPYVVDGYPSIVYLDQDTALRAANLLTVIKEYAEQESAKFVTGARPLSELDAYFAEIERLGATEYVQIYQDYYDSMSK